MYYKIQICIDREDYSFSIGVKSYFKGVLMLIKRCVLSFGEF